MSKEDDYIARRRPRAWADDKLEPCGSRAGYVRHRRDGEDACPACRRANAEAAADYRRRSAS